MTNKEQMTEFINRYYPRRVVIKAAYLKAPLLF